MVVNINLWIYNHIICKVVYNNTLSVKKQIFRWVVSVTDGRLECEIGCFFFNIRTDSLMAKSLMDKVDTFSHELENEFQVDMSINLVVVTHWNEK